MEKSNGIKKQQQIQKQTTKRTGKKQQQQKQQQQQQQQNEIIMKTKQKILCAKIKNEIGEKLLKQNHRKWGTWNYKLEDETR